jgi:hypothetical protein
VPDNSRYCSACGSATQNTTHNTKTEGVGGRDAALQLFQDQYKNIVNAQVAAPASPASISKKHGPSILEAMGNVLSAYPHDNEFFPCINSQLEVFNRFGLHGAPNVIFTKFGVRTGRAVLSGRIRNLEEFRREAWLQASVYGPGEQIVAENSSLICANDACKTGLTGLKKPKACPACGGDLGILLFRLPPKDPTKLTPREDPDFWGLLVENDGLNFQSDSPPQKISFEEAALISIHFYPSPISKIAFSGKLLIKIFDKKANCIYANYSREQFKGWDFRSFVATLSAKANGVLILDTL